VQPCGGPTAHDLIGAGDETDSLQTDGHVAGVVLMGVNTVQ
jgi:hypothetical protein